MESLLVRALESKLKYWLRTFSRDQFKLQGRSVHLHNLDLNGDVLHAAIGLPPTLRVSQARVRKFELKLPPITSVNSEPIIVEIDKLDLVLVETSGAEHDAPVAGNKSALMSTKTSTGYGFADKIADGMTVAVRTVNLMLETRGGGTHGGAAWIPPLASVTIRNLLLYTTNEHWKIVNLKEAREFFTAKKCIYIFKKLEWESLSVDLLPHPDMFADEMLDDTNKADNRDNTGAKRKFFGGERFLESISGTAYITIHKTELNNPLALEVQVHVPETLCPALSEPGLRALLRFMTGVYVCINRGDVNCMPEQLDEVAGRTMLKVTVDHMFLCITDADFQLELVLQSLNYVRASVADRNCSRTMSRLELANVFLRDTHSTPTCPLVLPSERSSPDFPPVPSFASEKLWPRIYPLESRLVIRDVPPILCMFASQTTPSPVGPNLASQIVVQCRPLMINLQEDSCIRIASFISDGVIVEPALVLPDTSLSAMYFSLKECDVTVPLGSSKFGDESLEGGFTGVRLHIEGFMVAQSPFLTFRFLNLDEDPSCFAFWKGQPIDSSQQRWVMRATDLSIALEGGICDDSAQARCSSEWTPSIWRCVVMVDPCIEAAMVTADGKSMLAVPPPGGIVRLGVSCKTYTSNTSTEQLLFVLRMYRYVGEVGRTLLRVSKGFETGSPTAGKQDVAHGCRLETESSLGGPSKIAAGDCAVILKLGFLELKLLESVPGQTAVEGPCLVQILSHGIVLKATHRMLGGAAVFSSSMSCHDVRVECVETELRCPRVPVGLKEISGESLEGSKKNLFTQGKVCSNREEYQTRTKLHAVLWIGKERGSMVESQVTGNGFIRSKHSSFLDATVIHMIPLRREDSDCHSLKVTVKLSGVRLGGGVFHVESLLHRSGVLGPDGGPRKDVKKMMETLSSSPFAEFLRPSSGIVGVAKKVDEGWEVGIPEDISLDLELRDWLFALGGSDSLALHHRSFGDSSELRHQKPWHLAFHCLRVLGLGRKSEKKDLSILEKRSSSSSPLQEITFQVEGLQALKPQVLLDRTAVLDMPCLAQIHREEINGNGGVGSPESDNCIAGKTSQEPLYVHVTSNQGVTFTVSLVENIEKDDCGGSTQQWAVENIEAGVKEPIEFKATRVEVESLVHLVKLEIESASRVAVCVMKLLEFDGPVGQSAINQLNRIGSSIWSLESKLTSDNLYQRTTDEGNIPAHSSRCNNSCTEVEPTLTALEAAISKSRNLCVDLRNVLDGTGGDGEQRASGFFELNSMSSLNDLSVVVGQLHMMEDLILNLRRNLHQSNC